MNDNAKRWVAALRSGEYEQGTGALHRQGRYCCLGVACELAAREERRIVMTSEDDDAIYYDGHWADLPLRVMAWLGLRTPAGEFLDGTALTLLTLLNDKRKYTFEEIADVIESEPEGLFVP